MNWVKTFKKIYCLLSNRCAQKDLCCNFCKDKKCTSRCTDNYKTCAYLTDEIRDEEEPFIVAKPKTKKEKQEIKDDKQSEVVSKIIPRKPAITTESLIRCEPVEQPKAEVKLEHKPEIKQENRQVKQKTQKSTKRTKKSLI